MTTIEQLRQTLERLRELTKEWSDYGTLGENDEDREFEQKWQDALTLLDQLEAEHKTQVAKLTLGLLKGTNALMVTVNDQLQDLIDRCEDAKIAGKD